MAQEKWAHTAEGMKKLGGPRKVAEWDAATKGQTLPERATLPMKGREKGEKPQNQRHTPYR